MQEKLLGQPDEKAEAEPELNGEGPHANEHAKVSAVIMWGCGAREVLIVCRALAGGVPSA